MFVGGVYRLLAGICRKVDKFGLLGKGLSGILIHHSVLDGFRMIDSKMRSNFQNGVAVVWCGGKLNSWSTGRVD
jgi:hypothetical protein